MAETKSSKTINDRVVYQKYGYDYSHLNRYARISPARTCRLTVYYGYIDGPYLDLQKLYESRRIYIGYFQCKFFPALVNAKKVLYENLVIDRHLSHVGSTSYVEKSNLKMPDNQTVLAEVTVALVSVDNTNRKKIPLPDWFQEKYGHIQQPISYLDFPQISFPWSCKVIVQARDTDDNNHCNFASYISFLDDSIYKYKKSQTTSDWLKDHYLEDIALNYLGDCIQGDELQINIAPGQGSEMEFWASIVKIDKVIVQAKMKYMNVLNAGLWSSL